jgi:hypothetical protein
MRRVLSVVQQRNPAALNKAADELCEKMEESIKALVEQLIVSLSVVSPYGLYPTFISRVTAFLLVFIGPSGSQTSGS